MTERSPVVYVLKRFPRLSETFILRELLELERQGQPIAIEALLPPEAGHGHPELAALKATVRYLPRHPSLRQPRVALAHLAVARRHPTRWWREAIRARRTRTWRRFLQAGLVAHRTDRLQARHLHAHFATAAADVARIAGGLTHTPFSVTAHAKDIFHRDNQAFFRSRVDGAAAIVTVSRYNTEHLRSVLRGAATPIHYIPNGVELPPPPPPCPTGPVLCVARLVPKKGIDTLIKACALTGADGPDLEIIGGGELLSELAQLVDELGLEGRVRLLGPRPSPEVDAAFARCSIVALPCRVAADGDRDGLPTVLLEALARGRAVISTDIIGIPEVVRDGVTGLLVPPDDPHALAAAILQLWNDPALAIRMGDSGRQLISQDYEPTASAARLRSIFHGAFEPANQIVVPA